MNFTGFFFGEGDFVRSARRKNVRDKLGIFIINVKIYHKTLTFLRYYLIVENRFCFGQ